MTVARILHPSTLQKELTQVRLFGHFQINYFEQLHS